MEASALTHASQRGLLARRSPLLKLQGDRRLIAMARSGNAGAFETIVDRYQGRLLGFCRQMLGSTEDAEDVLQEVFVNAYRAMLADEREINLRPWLYRIARNRCLNHLRKPTADARDSMDLVPAAEAASTAERVHNREEFRQLLNDVGRLPETQRSALLLRELDAMSYEEIAQAMDTSVPSVKSLLVRARISLAEASQARQLTCGEVRLELAETTEGLRKVSGPARRHVRDCKQCTAFRAELRANGKALAALSPAGPLLALKAFLASKLGLGGGASAGAGAGGVSAGAATSAGAAAGAGAAATGAGAAAGAGAALGGGGAAGGLGAVGGALGTKAVAGVVTAAVITAGAVEVKQYEEPGSITHGASISRTVHRRKAARIGAARVSRPVRRWRAAPQPASTSAAAEPAPAATEAPPTAETSATTGAPTAEGSSAGGNPPTGGTGATKIASSSVSGATVQPGAPPGADTVVVAVGAAPSQAAPVAETPPPAETPPVTSPPPAEVTPTPESTPPSAEATPPSAETAGSEPAPEPEPEPEAEAELAPTPTPSS